MVVGGGCPVGEISSKFPEMGNKLEDSHGISGGMAKSLIANNSLVSNWYVHVLESTSNCRWRGVLSVDKNSPKIHKIGDIFDYNDTTWEVMAK